jgi:membrane protein
MKDKFSRLREWLIHAEAAELGRIKRQAVRLTRFLWVVGEQFLHDRCMRKSAALTYTSILSLFPLLAVISIFAARFYADSPEALEGKVETLLERYVLPSGGGEGAETLDTPFAQNIIEVYKTYQQRTKTIFGLGSAGLFLAAIALFLATEKFFNEIWRVQTRRPYLRMFSAFATSLVSLPILIAAATYAKVFFESRLMEIDEFLGSKQGFAPLAALLKFLAGLGGQFAPFLLISLALACAYYLIPNTRVRFRSAAVGGLIAGLLWVIAKKSFYLYVGRSEITRNVFGAFGATLVFLVWLYILWAIILLGAQAAYLSQHFDYVLRERFGTLRYTLDDPRLFVLVLGRIGEAFARNEGGIEFDDLRERTGLRESDLENILEPLRDKGFVALRDDGKLAVARPLENLRLAEVFDLGCRTAPLASSGEGEDGLAKVLEGMDQVLAEKYGQKSLGEFLREGDDA